jgi:hypothetical protein
VADRLPKEPELRGGETWLVAAGADRESTGIDHRERRKPSARTRPSGQTWADRAVSWKLAIYRLLKSLLETVDGRSWAVSVSES